LLDAVNGEVSFVALVVDRWRTWAIPVIKLICLAIIPEEPAIRRPKRTRLQRRCCLPPKQKKAHKSCPDFVQQIQPPNSD